MTRLQRLALALVACAPLALPAGAGAASPSYPSISKASPLKLGVGDTLTVRGEGFRAGHNRTTVVFKRDGGRAVFVRATKASKTQLKVVIPSSMFDSLTMRKGKPSATRFRLRALTGRLGRRYTSLTASPMIGVDPVDPDDADGDKLSDAKEIPLGLNPFKEDTDEDGASDGFEYYSAKDLNGAALPFPGKRPYPNGLDKEDGGIDHDGDGLTLLNEYKAWTYTGAPLPLSYSDGNQNTRGGEIDAYKDVDGDGASNFAEVGGPLSGPEYWTAWIKDNNLGCPGGEKYVESTYPGPKYTGLNFVDPDSDGDGVPDGADDIDHDGLSNLEESQYTNPNGRVTARRLDWCAMYVSTGPALNGGLGHNDPADPSARADADRYARTNPFNPCKPVYSAACHKFVPLGHYVKTEDYVEDWAGAAPNR